MVGISYEEDRLKRYIGVRERDIEYSYEELLKVFRDWVIAEGTEYRHKAWDTYCDIRDRVPTGTNHRLRYLNKREGVQYAS